MTAALPKSDYANRLWTRALHSAVLYGALATTIRVGANVLLLPLVLKVLAPGELAVWYVFLALGGVANLADFGFGPAITRVYSFFWAGAEDFDTQGLRPPPENRSPNLAAVARVHAAAKMVYLRIAGAALVLLITVGTLCLLRPLNGLDFSGTGWGCWAGFVVALTFSLATSHWMLACQGVNQVRDLQRAHLASGLVYAISAAALLLGGFGLSAMVIATGIRAVVARQMCRRAYFAVVPESAIASRQDVASITRRIWPNAWKFGLITLGGFLTAQANVLVSSQLLAPELTASYAVSTQIGTFIMTFSALWLGVKWPEITMLRTQGRVFEMSVLFARRLVFVMVTFVTLALLLLAFGNRVLEWKGTQTRFLPAAYMAVYLVYLFQQQFYVQFGSLAYTENEVPFFSLAIFSGIAVTLSSVLLTKHLGLWGLILGPLIITVTSCAWYVTWRGFRGQPLTVIQFARAAVFGRV